MPYITSESVAAKREAIKKAFPGYKFSITKEHHSSICVHIMEGPIDLLPLKEEKHESINHFYIERCGLPKEAIELLQGVYEICNSGNGVLIEGGDYGTVPNFYVHLAIGKYDKSYTVKAGKTVASKEVAIAPVEVEAGTIQVIEYSEKAIAVIGDTKPIKDKLKELGGKFNFRLSCGPGWIFPKTKLELLQTSLAA